MSLAWIAIVALVYTKTIPMGILFAWAIFNVLYYLIVSMNKNYMLNKTGMLYLALGFICAATTGLYLFYDYNVLTVILRN